MTNQVTRVLNDAKGLLSYTRNRHEALVIANLIRELENSLEGLYRVYVNIGEDTDGARNAEQLFGPWVGFDPAAHIPQLVADFRKESEEDYEIDLANAWDDGWDTGDAYASEMATGSYFQAVDLYDKKLNPHRKYLSDEAEWKMRQRQGVRGVRAGDANGAEVPDAHAKWERGEL